MSEASVNCLTSLPTELLYRIFDNLHGQVIILSLVHVCKRLDAVIKIYLDRISQTLNFDRMAKYHFMQVCRFIQPENVIALTLSDLNTTAGQISLFLSYFSMERFIHLRSLTLLNIEDEHLQRMLKHAITCSLISLSIQEKAPSKRSIATNALLSTILGQGHLRKLTLTLVKEDQDLIKWPISSTIQHLTLFDCHIKQFSTIFQRFSSLQTLTIKNCDVNCYSSLSRHRPLNLIPRYQLTSLTMKNPMINMNTMTWILSGTPSLTYLQLTGSIDRIDFQWEEFIQTKLPLLNRFEFSFYIRTNDSNDSNMINTFLIPFRTPFWLEIKKWFVNYDEIRYIDSTGRASAYDIQLYSIPFCDHSFEYYPDSQRATSTTSCELIQNGILMDYVRPLYKKAEIIMNTTRTTENIPDSLNSMRMISMTHLFRKASHLQIRYDSSWSFDFIQRLSSLIELSHVKKLTLIDEYPQNYYPNTSVTFLRLLAQTPNLHTLIIIANSLERIPSSNMEQFSAIFPHCIKHLQIDSQLMNGMKIILDRLEHLSNVTFRSFTDKRDWQTMLMKWFLEKRDVTHRIKDHNLHIWLGEKTNTSEPMTTTSHNKRFKTVYY